MDSSPSNAPTVDSASDLLKDLRLVGRSRHGKNMDGMEMDLKMEVPDTPDRLAMMSPQDDDDDDDDDDEIAARKTPYRSHNNIGLRGEETRSSSCDAHDNESLFRKARLAFSISKSQDYELRRQSQGIRQEHEKDSFRSLFASPVYDGRGIEKRGKVNDADKRPPSGVHSASCGDNNRKMALDLHNQNEEVCNDHLKGIVSSPTGPLRRTQSGTVNFLEISDPVCKVSGKIEIDVTNAGRSHCFKESFPESRCNENKISSSSDSIAAARKVASKPLQFHAYRRTTERRRLVRNGCISPNNIANDTSHLVNTEASPSSIERVANDKGKGIDLSDGLQDKDEKAPLRQCQFDVRKKNTGQRKLVRNGCISPLNIASGGRNVIDQPDGFLLPQFHVVNSDSEPRQTNKMKGKEFLIGTTKENGQEVRSHMSSRGMLTSGKDTIIDAEAIADIVQPAGEMGWRSTRNRTGKDSHLPYRETPAVVNRNINSFHSSDQHHNSKREDKSFVNMVCPRREFDSSKATVPSSLAHESNPSQYPESSDIIFELEPDIRRNCGAQRLRKGKRKSSSNHAYVGECSSSTFDISEVRSSKSSGEPLSANSTRPPNSQYRGIASVPIIDVDKLPSPSLRSTSPHNGCYMVSEDSVTRAQQVESDEMLARQLQEQLFNESPVVDAEEIDAGIAWTLQQEEDAQHDSFIRSHGQPHPRRYRQYSRQSSGNSSLQLSSRARINSSARMAQLRRNMRREMDLETRLNFLEALEAAYDNGNASRVNILQIQRDFNESDYEMLLSLDDDNHQHAGASLRQINSLPQSIIQTDNVEEECAICLEKPTIGDTIRHLPCLHKFHKDCIDAWLKRRTSCPICKSGIE